MQGSVFIIYANSLTKICHIRSALASRFLSVGSIHRLQEFFEDSLILQLYWENKIDLIKGKEIKIEKKITFLTLIRKFYGKKIRGLISFFKKK